MLSSLLFAIFAVVLNTKKMLSVLSERVTGTTSRRKWPDDGARKANSLEETEFLFDSDLIKKPSFLRL